MSPGGGSPGGGGGPGPAAPSVPPGQPTAKAQLEQLNTMRESLFSLDGWGGVSTPTILSINQSSTQHMIIPWIQLLINSLDVFSICMTIFLCFVFIISVTEFAC